MIVNDLTGKKINHWTILKELGGGKVLCQCDCEEAPIKELYKKAVISGKTKSCGCERKNNTVKPLDKFFEWTVLEKRQNRYVLCQCSCGKIAEVFEGSLKNGRSKSCGHKKITKKTTEKTTNSIKMDFSIEGQTFGYLLVTKKLNKDKALCKCTACGKEVETYISRLKRGSSKSCGCMKAENRKITEDKNFNNKYVGKKYGYLEIIGRGSAKEKVLCKCVCGNTKEIYIQALKNGSTKSCGCKSIYLRNKKMYAKYGEITPNKIYNPREEWQIRAISSKENLIEYLQTLNDKPFIYELCSSLNLQDAQLLTIIHKFNLEDYINWNRNQSRYEQELYNFIKGIYSGEIIQHSRNIISPSEIDIYIPKENIAIEFNGDYWHSSEKISKNYHLEKTVACKNNNIKLIHIFEYEWINNKEKIKNYLSNILKYNQNVIYARETKVHEINSDDAYKFEELYHIQGRANSEINIGLSKNNQLLALMTFGKPRFDNNVQYELIRLCYTSNTIIVGGSEKLFKFFVEKYKPTSIISYSNIAKFDGKVYNRIGFSIESFTEPNYVWVNNKYEVLQRYKTQKKMLVEKGLGTNNETEDIIMKRLGYNKIYDCGNVKYIYNIV